MALLSIRGSKDRWMKDEWKKESRDQGGVLALGMAGEAQAGGEMQWDYF